ncbi:uncharacterized protein B0H18DRAFT_1005958 [Fomitopsis serialis]|uniref:uncharacterized protein n=1 Tax=Fomitopsis serialis TaxID=139415 RepID=UPI0020074319|nr:uncharacterized protein B0H18DRAFT_1005958 [Neoantrodia serialis]KAH9926409.1 hypothetical protein B0H18DRAFT_1005958 [Neoantrodia serialis]
MGDADSVIELSSSPEPPALAWRPPTSKNLSGRSFHFGGVWAAMSMDQAKELCRANGGTISVPPGKPSYVVVGARSPPSTFENAKRMGKQVLTETQFIAMALREPLGTSQSSAQAGEKRPAEAEAGPSKSAKKRKSDVGYPAAPDFPRICNFLYGGEIRLEKKKLSAYDCGGGVFQQKRGKNPVDLLQKFEDWLPEDGGEYHHKIVSFY